MKAAYKESSGFYLLFSYAPAKFNSSDEFFKNTWRGGEETFREEAKIASSVNISSAIYPAQHTLSAGILSDWVVPVKA